MTKHSLCALTIVGSLALFSAETVYAQVVELLPNLTPFPAMDIRFKSDGTATLQFSTVSQNGGSGPMELIGGPTDPVAEKQVVYQRIFLSNGTYFDRIAGAFEYHEEHFHFHLNGYAKYILRPIGTSGNGDVESEKTSFCLIDNQPVNLTLPGAPQQPVYTTCNPDQQGISVGWGDKYGYQLPGQSFDVSGKPDGDYQLIVQIDPLDHLRESDETDNTSCVVVRLNISARTLSLRGACSSTNVTVSSITPNSISPGGSMNVTIKGTGFVAGLAVGFENGSGPAPIASFVQFVDASTITARVSVKSGGSRRPRVWDVRVGPAVLPRGFTVTP